MTLNSTSGSSPIFQDGKLKPWIYKIQNIYVDTYLDIEVHSRDVCCRPAKDLGAGRGLVRRFLSPAVRVSDDQKWEIKQSGGGYTVQRFFPGEPEQFCAPLNGLQDLTGLCVGAFPVAWRVETVDNDQHRGFGYVRFYWGTMKTVWDLAAGRKDNGAKVVAYHETSNAWQIWRLVPVKVDPSAPPHLSAPFEPLEPGYLPSYEGDAGQSSTHAQRAESESDEFGTIVNEVTVVTTTNTVTTRKRYRVEDA